MDRCPELVELEAFFGVSARAAYGDVGWYYDSLSFDQGSASEHLMCTMEPAEGTFTILRSVGGHVQLDLAFHCVVSLELEHSAGAALLIGRISQGGVEQLFKLSLAPVFSFRLSMQLPALH